MVANASSLGLKRLVPEGVHGCNNLAPLRCSSRELRGQQAEIMLGRAIAGSAKKVQAALSGFPGWAVLTTCSSKDRSKPCMASLPSFCTLPLAWFPDQQRALHNWHNKKHLRRRIAFPCIHACQIPLQRPTSYGKASEASAVTMPGAKDATRGGNSCKAFH